MEKEKFIMTDSDSYQICRNLEPGVFELYQLQEHPEEDAYFVCHAIVYLKDVNAESICDCYGYRNLAQMKQDYGKAYEQALAECEFELLCQSLDCVVNRGTPLSWERAVKMIQELSGYVPDKRKTVKMKSSVKYAVSIYGIRTDKIRANDGKSIVFAGLTFGPAIGASYTDSFVDHEPSGVTKNGNPHRCVHHDDWKTIVFWSRKDPKVYEQCLGGNIRPACTKAVPLHLNDKLKSCRDFSEMPGDGAGMLKLSLRSCYRMWNNCQSEYFTAYTPEYDYGTSRGGWPDSKIRNTLNGTVTENMKHFTNKGASLSDEGNALISCFPEELKNAIAPRLIISKGITWEPPGVGVRYSDDRLWLFSRKEAEDLPEWANEIRTYDEENRIPPSRKYRIYDEKGEAGCYWLGAAAPCDPGATKALCMDVSGKACVKPVSWSPAGLSFGFCLE